MGAWHSTGTRRGDGCVGRAGHGDATRPAGRPGRAGWAKLGHCAPDPIFTQFLDSVLFLSEIMETVHEPSS